MNHRLTMAAAAAVILASSSEFFLIHGAAWLVEAAGATLVVALAGTLTRLSPVPSAIGATLLAGAATTPMLAAQSPYLKIAAAVIIICCAASASGLRALRSVAGLATYLAALLLYLNILLAGGQSLLAVIPTAASLHHLVTLANSGITLTKYPPPVLGSNRGIQLLAAGSIGLAAVLVDFVAVRLRKPAIAGLPLLVIYMAPIATTAHIGGLGGAATFLLAAGGYLALLSSDGRSRLRAWGRVITVWHASGEDDRLGGADIGALTATGRRIGLAAVCLALAVPLVLPTLSPRKLFGGGNGTGPGGPGVTLPNPDVQLHGMLVRSRPEPVLDYRLAGPPQYFQVFVLNYDNSSGDWGIVRPSRSTTVGTGRGLQTAPGFTPSTPENLVTAHVTLADVSAGYSEPDFFLPVPYWPVKLHIQGDWLQADGTLMVYSSQAYHAGQAYTVTSGDAEPTPADLPAEQTIPAAIKKAYLTYRSLYDRQLKTIAERQTRGKTSAFAKAIALEQWFQSGRFSYNLRPDLPNSNKGLLDFLTVDRQGYCQQFAFAMAVLSRLLGIPARIAVGYTAGTRRPNGTWVVTTNDAHAWPELYLSGAGWVRFEPTPGGKDGQDTAFQPAWVTAASSGTSHPTTGPSQNATSSPGPSGRASAQPTHLRIVGQSGAGGNVPGPGGGGNEGGPIAVAVLALLVLAAAAPGTVRAVARHRHWQAGADDASLARAAWQELCADLEDYGMPCRASESPRTVARRLSAAAHLDDPARQAVARIATVVERARYAPRPQAAGPIRADVATVRRALARNSPRRTRWRARLAPASTLRPVREAARQGFGLLTGWAPNAGESSPA